MMRLRIAIGLGFLALGARAEMNPESFVKLCGAVQMVQAAAPDGRLYLGSGVLVAPGRMVTSCHVVRESSRVWFGRGGMTSEGEAMASDGERDLCVVRVPEARGAVPATRSASTLSVGEAVYAVGYSGGFRASISEGQVVALHPFGGGNIIQVTAPFGRGASGGGLFDTSGRLVGILTFYRPGEDGSLFFAVPIDWMEEVADGGFTPVAPLQGPSPFWAATEDALPAFLKAGTTVTAAR